MAEPSNNSIATRASLLNRLKDCDDHASWQDFYDRYRDLILAFALKAGLTETEAEEVVQETVIGVARKLPEFHYDPSKCSFKTWLLNQTMWRIKDQWRKRTPPHVRTAGDTTEDRTATVERIPDATVDQLNGMWEEDWRSAVLQAALQKVKARANLKDCQMFELAVLRQWPAKEVARAMSVSVARVYLAKHRVAPLVKKEVAQLESWRI